MSKTFAHLHNHSEYSLLDGAQTTEAMAKKGAELGLSALSLTDHGRMGGLVEFYSNCKKYGVKPILGMEAYITGIGRSRTDRTDWHKKTKEFIGTPRYERSNYHLILLAKNEQGYDNLCQLSTESYSTGFYQKPRIDYDLLEKYKDGLIVSSACFTAGNRVQIKNNNSSFSYPAMIAIEDVRPGMMVKTHTGSWKRVINRTTRDYNGTGYEIITDHMGIDDFPIVCTEDHKFLVYDSEDHCTKWIEARDLTTGTSLLLPIQKRKYSYYKKNKDKSVLSADDINQCYESISLRSKRNCYLKTDINLTPEIMMLFGLWLADGSITITDKSKTVTFTFNKSEYAVYFNSFVRKALDQLGINSYSVKNRDDHTRVDLTIGELSSVAIFKFIFGIHHAEDKFIPEKIKHISPDFDRALLYGYLLGDGCFGFKDQANGGQITSVSISKQLTKDIFEIWELMEFSPSVTHVNSYTDKKGVFHRENWSVHLNNTFLAEILDKNNIFECDRLRRTFEAAQLWGNLKNQRIIDIDGIHYRIKKIKYIKKRNINEPVYCLNVEDDHSFICNGVAVHNCVIGEVSSLLLNHNYKKAREVARWFKKTFGDDYYIELMNHRLAIEEAVMQPIRELADELGIKVIATNDDHYTNKEDHKLQKTLMLLGMHKSWADSDVYGSYFGSDEAEAGQRSVSDENGDSDPIFETPPELYMKNYDEMLEVLLPNGGEGGVAEQELENTNEIADKCNFDLPIIDPKDTSQYFLANYEIEQDKKYDDYHNDAYDTPSYIVDACIDEMHKLGHEDVNTLNDFMSDDEIKSLSFLMYLCENGIDKLIKPKVEALGEPLPMSYWMDNQPEGFEIKHAHNSPDELWIKAQLAEGKTPDDIINIYRNRLAYETSIICAKKFVNYFLIVQSYVNFTRERGAAIGPGRGSSCGALICYLSGITSVDPIPNDLMFERFLNPDRSGYP